MLDTERALSEDTRGEPPPQIRIAGEAEHVLTSARADRLVAEQRTRSLLELHDDRRCGTELPFRTPLLRVRQHLLAQVFEGWDGC